MNNKEYLETIPDYAVNAAINYIDNWKSVRQDFFGTTYTLIDVFDDLLFVLGDPKESFRELCVVVTMDYIELNDSSEANWDIYKPAFMLITIAMQKSELYKKITENIDIF